MLWISKHVVIGFLVFASCLGGGRKVSPAPAMEEAAEQAPAMEETDPVGSTGITMRSTPDGRCG